MYCIKCKAQLNPGAKFCPYCGTNQQPVSVQTAPVRPQPPRPAAQSAPVQPAPIPVVPPVPQVAPIQQGTSVPPASNPQANPIRRAAPIPPVSNPQAAPRTAAPAAQYAQAPVTAPDSVFDFSRMENQCPPDSESEVTSTTMTPPPRDAQRRNTRRISGKSIAGIISGAAVLIAAAVVAAIMILPGVMANRVRKGDKPGQHLRRSLHRHCKGLHRSGQGRCCYPVFAGRLRHHRRPRDKENARRAPRQHLRFRK